MPMTAIVIEAVMEREMERVTVTRAVTERHVVKAHYQINLHCK